MSRNQRLIERRAARKWRRSSDPLIAGWMAAHGINPAKVHRAEQVEIQYMGKHALVSIEFMTLTDSSSARALTSHAARSGVRVIVEGQS